MSLGARALYPHLLINADCIGVVVNPLSVARGSDIPQPREAVEELERNGYLLSFGTSDGSEAWLIAHWFQQNRHDASKEARSAFMTEVNELFEEKNGIYLRCPETAPKPPQNRPKGNVTVTEDNLMECNSREPKGTQAKCNGASCPYCGGRRIEDGETCNGCSKRECVSCGGVYWVDGETGAVINDPYSKRPVRAR